MLVLRAGSEAQKSALLPALTAGELILTLAHTEPSPRYQPERVTTTARLEGNSWRLTGTKLFVPDAAAADHLVVVARTSGATTDPAGLTLFLVPRDTPGVTLTPLTTIASDRQYEVVLNDVRLPVSPLPLGEGKGEGAAPIAPSTLRDSIKAPPPDPKPLNPTRYRGYPAESADGSRPIDPVLGPVDGAFPILSTVLQSATILECVWMVGLAARALEMTVEFVKDRVQFGVPIGSFQAVQHRAADMATDLDAARFLAYEAAWKEGEGLLSPRDLAITKAWVSDAARRVVASAHQLHGGAGFIREVDLQLYFRRAKASEYRFGDADYHRAALARELFAAGG
jgi:alkylation response protein AidB-like acyl-CoA dehydrogenase